MGVLVPGKRYSTEQIIAKLREAEKLQGQGLNRPGFDAASFLAKDAGYAEEVPEGTA